MEVNQNPKLLCMEMKFKENQQELSMHWQPLILCVASPVLSDLKLKPHFPLSNTWFCLEFIKFFLKILMQSFPSLLLQVFRESSCSVWPKIPTPSCISNSSSSWDRPLLFSTYKMKIYSMQNSSLSFSLLCIIKNSLNYIENSSSKCFS